MSARKGRTGQTLVEFALAITVFLVLLMGVVDFGMAVYKFNGVSQAAREIARVTSVHPCAGTTPCVPGSSAETAAALATQKSLIPGLTNMQIKCVDQAGVVVAPNPCNFATDSIQVTIEAPYQPITPLLRLSGTWTMKGSSSAQIQ